MQFDWEMTTIIWAGGVSHRHEASAPCLDCQNANASADAENPAAKLSWSQLR